MLKPVEITPQYLDSLIDAAAVFKKINYSIQAIVNLLVDRPNNTADRVRYAMSEYNITAKQAVFAMNMPAKYACLFFDEEECPRTIERLVTLRRILQETQDVFNKWC